jgi:hypothetical protein
MYFDDNQERFSVVQKSEYLVLHHKVKLKSESLPKRLHTKLGGTKCLNSSGISFTFFGYFTLKILLYIGQRVIMA